jgi:uncharacterized SAM-binding protein YcdF (DUF218 family)
MRWERLWQFVGLAGIAVFILSAYSPLPNALFRWSASPSDVQPADAIVVLGASVAENGQLSAESLRRTVRGMTLYRAGQAPVIVFSGIPNLDVPGPSEAEVRARLARELGIPREAILLEERAFTTREEANRIGEALRARGARRILLVTDPQHMGRARALFEHVGLQVLPAVAEYPRSAARSPEERLRLMRETLGELLSLTYHRVAGYL